MAEKSYHEIREERGTIHISHEVIAQIASVACLETPGVAAMAPIGNDSGVKGIIFTPADGGDCTIDAHIMVKLGETLSETAENAQLAVKNAVESASGLNVTKVNVFVAGISLK